MDQERFDEITRRLASGASRRTVVGGAIAGLVGAGVASVSGLAKRKKGKKRKKAGAEAVCVAGDCPAGQCCQSTPPGNDVSCIPEGALDGTPICSDGGGLCFTCPEGTLCDIATFRCICSPLSCDGCCIDNSGTGDDDQCIANGSGEPVNSPNPTYDGSFVCGVNGSICNICSVGTLFSGCCSETGFCSAGTSNNNCGSSGELCETCENDSTCGIDQACTGGTTTTTTTSAPEGCGPGTANPCTNGCCAETSPGVFRCESGGAKNACGTGGAVCKKCGGRKKCTGKGRCKKRKN